MTTQEQLEQLSREFRSLGHILLAELQIKRFVRWLNKKMGHQPDN